MDETEGTSPSQSTPESEAERESRPSPPPSSAEVPPSPPLATGEPFPDRPAPASDTSKVLAAVGYPIWIVALVAILIEPYKDERFVRFHAMQALGLNLAIWVVVVALNVSFIGAALSGLAGLVGFIYAITIAVKTWNGEYVEVPVVYGLVKGWIEQ